MSFIEEKEKWESFLWIGSTRVRILASDRDKNQERVEFLMKADESIF